VDPAAGMRHGDGFRFAVGGACKVAHHLPKVKFGHDERFDVRGQVGDLFSGKGQAVMSRNFPTRSPRSRAASIARCAMREVVP